MLFSFSVFFAFMTAASAMIMLIAAFIGSAALNFKGPRADCIAGQAEYLVTQAAWACLVFLGFALASAALGLLTH